MKLEVISTSVEDAILAESNGANRLELISGICEGGVTPSAGLIKRTVQAVSIPVHVMIRPHSNTFHYTASDLEVMTDDIRTVRQSGAAGIVIGCLTPDHRVDEPAMRRLLDEAGELAVTFHRAFDETERLEETLETISRFPQINRILTSGGKPNVLDAKEEISRLVSASAAHGITILPGSGLHLEALEAFMRDTGVTEVHLGTGVRRHNRALDWIDPVKVRAAADLIAKVKASRS